MAGLADDETWYTGTTVTTTTGVADRRERVLSPVFNQLSVIRRRIEMSRSIIEPFVPSLTLLHIGICYRGSVPSWSSRNLMLRSFLTVTSRNSTRLQLRQFLVFYVVIIVTCRATSYTSNLQCRHRHQRSRIRYLA